MGHEIAGRFVLLDQIGVGGMGSVWRAWDRRTSSFVAAKVLGQAEGDTLLRFVREQSLRIVHPHIVSPTSWAAEDDQVVLTMDLVAGGSVADLLRDHGPLPAGFVAVVLDQVLQALGAAHDAGIVHRDLKPANLLLEPTGTGRPHVRLADFGVAARAEDIIGFPGIVGTDGYMPPEQAAGAPPHPTQDLYAAGRVAVQLLTGLRPLQQHGVPDGPLAPLLREMTDTDPTRRPLSAAVARERLAALEIPFRSGGRHLPLPDVPVRIGDVDAPGVPAGEGVLPATRRSAPIGHRAVSRSPRRAQLSIVVSLMVLVACAVTLSLVLR
ncbi:serine/threonine-protein kinase [Nocardioides sp.]|uniref:serine/threonine-protein kinase n=1 Tax=Nocardioides sp. TaxID=35761 RepID=UPI0027345095|nr:serine/threonine-protein kinase [Nocardioides sp.]MDP3893239.1 serine/threonine-protein kinase [Nocardioides sp.]